MHRSQPALPLRGGALVTNQRPPQRDGSLLRVLAVPDPSARSRVGGRGRRSRCPPVAPPNPIASTTPLIGRRQRLSRRRRRRATAIVDDRPSPGMPPRCQRASITFRSVTRRRARARAVVPTTQGRTGRVRRRPARASPLPLLNGADRGGFAAASMHRSEPALPLRGGALVTNQRPPQRDGSLLRVPAVPVPSARSWVGGRRRRRRCPPVALPNPIASTTPLIGRRQRLSRRRRKRNSAVVEDRPSSGMPRDAIARPSLSGASPVAVPVPAPASPRQGDERAACADARHGRRPSPSSTGPTVAALPPQARIAASRPTPSGAECWSPISARPRGSARCHACRRCRLRRLDLGSGEEDSDADVRPSRRRMRSRRRRP